MKSRLDAKLGFLRWIGRGLVLVLGASALAQPMFLDDFNSGASPLWSSQFGGWVAENGVYRATAPGNYPNANSALPFDLVDFSADLDVRAAEDGGVWLRSASAAGTRVERKGVLLVFARGNLYWHVLPDGNDYGSALHAVGGVFTPRETDFHLHIEVVGNTYAVYLNGATAPTTSITTDLFASGQMALYSYGWQTFDNVRLQDRPKLLLSDPLLRGPDQFECRVTGPISANFQVDVTTDFTGWTNVFTGNFTNSTVTVTIPAPSGQSHQFYRAVIP